MSEVKELKRRIAKTLRTLDELIDSYTVEAVKLGREIGREDILSSKKIMEAVKVEVIRGLPSVQLPGYGDVFKSTRELPG